MKRAHLTIGESMRVDVALEQTRGAVTIDIVKMATLRTVVPLRFAPEIARDLATAILEAADTQDGAPWQGPSVDDPRKLLRELGQRSRYDRIGREIAAGTRKRARKGKGGR